MTTPSILATPAAPVIAGRVDGSHSAVSWSAVFAGAVISTAVTAMLLFLGSGIGFASISPWQNTGAAAGTLAVGAVIWLIVVQWISSLFAGYIAGRLRTRSTGLHTDEVFFRDTAHGFAAWAVATLLTISIVASAGTALVGAGARAVGGAAGSAIQGASQAGATASLTNPSSAFVDTLFRPAQPTAATNSTEAKAEAGRIVAASLSNGSLAPGDRTYLAQLAAVNSGISVQDAEKRIDDMVTAAKAAADKAKATADEAREQAAKLSFFTFFSMLIGAFIATAAGALGGKLRDE